MSTHPAHDGLAPRPFKFSPLPPGRLNHRLTALTGAIQVERAEHATPAPLGYYRFRMADGQDACFGKVVHRSCARRVSEAVELANASLLAGVPSAAGMPPIELDADNVLFLQRWVEGVFYRGTLLEMKSLGHGLARLHGFFRASAPPAAQAASLFWADSWRAIEDLVNGPLLSGEESRGAHELLERRDEVQAALTSKPQRLHNDLHPGNVLFDGQGGLIAFLDFEEALTSSGSPWIDLAWVVERFCLVGCSIADGQARAKTFLAAYALRSDLPQDTALPSLRDAIVWKNYHALGILNRHRNQLPGSALPEGEWAKFIQLLRSAARDLGPLAEAVFKPAGS